MPVPGGLGQLGDAAACLIGRYDHITHLPNRLRFLDDFPILTQGGPAAGRLLMLVTLADARHYNEILRALGHAFAEDFVRAGAAQLIALLPVDLPIYHVSVLSFAFVVEHGGDDAPPLAHRIARNFAGAVMVDTIPIKTRAGTGLLRLDGAAAEPAEALRAVLVAAQDSRQIDGGVAFYNHKSDAAHIRAFRILADLPAALEKEGQLSLHYQPRIKLETGACIGAEALLRWQHPELGAISPGEFIPLVEQTALINSLTDWVFDHAVRQAARLTSMGHHLRISINASPVNLSEPGFDDHLLHLCDRHGLGPEHIEVEFTEGAFAGNFDRIALQLNRLRGAGIHVALDDFGAGSSNLGYLRRIPADVLKIDQSFIRPLGAADSDDFLVRQIVAIAKGLGFRVCAEGIETQRTYAFLKGLGCDEGQGFLMARPMHATVFESWLAESR